MKELLDKFELYIKRDILGYVKGYLDMPDKCIRDTPKITSKSDHPIAKLMREKGGLTW